MPTISPIIRITVGLLLLTISLLLIGDMLGIIPNKDKSRIELRKALAESLAIQTSSEISQNNIKSATLLLNLIAQRNDKILSMALRNNYRKIIMQTKEHSKYWSLDNNTYSSSTNINVPIYNHDGKWGTLEVSFKSLDINWENILNESSLISTIVFLFVFGFFLFWIFLKRVLSELDPGSAIPDRVRSALDILTEGLIILDSSERIVFVNKSFKIKTGLDEKYLIGKNLSFIGWKKEKEELILKNHKFPWSVLFDTGTPPETSNLILQKTNGEALVFDVKVAPIQEINQKMKGAIVTINDITELDKKNKELAHILQRLEKSKEEISKQNIELIELATRDPLTHLLNRRSLFESFNAMLIEARSTNAVISCVILDIDHFKKVNDTYGHGVGDKVIKIFAMVLENLVQDKGIIGRYGGEEFVVVFPGLDEEEASLSAEKIRRFVCSKVHEGLPEELLISSSFGVVSTESGIWESDTLIDLADQALYVAKKSGRNLVIRYSQMDEEIKEILITDEAPKNSRNTENKNSNTSNISKDVLSGKSVNEEGDISLEAFNIMGILGRTVILDRIKQAMKLAQRNSSNLSILTIHINTIKQINNAIGYHTAEKFRKVAFERLVETFRSSDSVMPDSQSKQNIGLSRASDSEFIAILTGIQQATITTWIINRMLKDLAIPLTIDGHSIVMQADIGVSVYPDDASHPDDLLKNSNIALQAAQKQEDTNFLFFSEKINQLCKHELEIESQLHQALKKDELFLHYQPIISLKTGRVEKFEALLRWNHPTLGLVSPSSFIEIAEHTGAIKEIGLWTIKKSCMQLHAWHIMGYKHLKISINLSAIQFYSNTLAEDIISEVVSANISPRLIVLELTETTLLKNQDSLLKTLTKLDDAGFEIALDDFGTGYSSLDYLRKFPISILKIDQSLMENFPESIDDVSIVGALVSLAHNLGMHVIAEGVEKEIQLSALHDFNCNEIQGYFISRALSPHDATEFLSTTYTQKLIRKINSKAKIKTQEIQSFSNIINPFPIADV